uniref:Secreted protein n=1 Tax=Panagrellus redivivus TaxID=6233 RepID=A0A7E4UU46_PANRE
MLYLIEKKDTPDNGLRRVPCSMMCNQMHLVLLFTDLLMLSQVILEDGMLSKARTISSGDKESGLFISYTKIEQHDDVNSIKIPRNDESRQRQKTLLSRCIDLFTIRQSITCDLA